MKRLCALVLANVPHSDDMSDDPLKYIAAQIQEGNAAHAARKPKAKQERKTDPVQNVGTAANVTHPFLDLQDDSATPSETSHRDTFTPTDYSTPLTSAGLTPGETARRFSDAARKSITSTKKPGSSLRNEANTKPRSRTTSNGGVPQPLEPNKPSLEVEATKKTLRLVTDGSSRPQTRNTRSMDNPRPVRFSIPNLNKSLPPPPPPDSASIDDEKQPHISRLMKTIRKKKSITTEGKGFSTASAPPVPSAEEVWKAASPRADPPRTPFPQSTTQEAPKRRFRLRLFPKRQRPTDFLVT